MRAVPSEEYVYRSARTIKYACPGLPADGRSGERSDLYPANEYFAVDPRRPDEDGNRPRLLRRATSRGISRRSDNSTTSSRMTRTRGLPSKLRGERRPLDQLTSSTSRRREELRKGYREEFARFMMIRLSTNSRLLRESRMHRLSRAKSAVAC